MAFDSLTFYERLRQLFQIRLASKWTETRVQYDNVKLNPVPSNSETWIALNIFYGSEKNVEFSKGVTRRQQGFVQVTIYVPVHTGTAVLSNHASKLQAIFSNYCTESLRVRDMDYRVIGVTSDNIWFRGVLTVYYNADVHQGELV